MVSNKLLPQELRHTHFYEPNRLLIEFSLAEYLIHIPRLASPNSFANRLWDYHEAAPSLRC